MKKYTNKKKTAITIAFMGILGLCAVMGMSQKKYKSTYASVEPNTQGVIFGENNETITLQNAELTYCYENLATYINEQIPNLSGTSITLTYDTYDESEFSFEELADHDYIEYDNNTNILRLSLFDTDSTFGYWYINNNQFDNDNSSLSWDISLLSESLRNNIANAIELDIQANQPPTQSESIISAITSGMGLAPDIANEFLKGFTAVFWDSTNSSLTRVSNFMLVMLGIAMVMAIIKLSLSLIRSNTGA